MVSGKFSECFKIEVSNKVVQVVRFFIQQIIAKEGKDTLLVSHFLNHIKKRHTGCALLFPLQALMQPHLLRLDILIRLQRLFPYFN